MTPPDAPVTFDHLRAEDGEHVGYLEMTADELFVPYDLLRRRRGEPMELEDAERTLDEIGLRLLAEDWMLQDEDGEWSRVRVLEVDRDTVTVGRVLTEQSAHVAKAVDLTARISLALPTERLRPV